MDDTPRLLPRRHHLPFLVLTLHRCRGGSEASPNATATRARFDSILSRAA
jgi:hypothetical protein